MRDVKIDEMIFSGVSAKVYENNAGIWYRGLVLANYYLDEMIIFFFCLCYRSSGSVWQPSLSIRGE